MQSKQLVSVLAYFALVAVLSIPFWVLGAANPVQLLPGLPLSALATLTPALAAVILTYRNDHLSGALQLLQRAFDFNRIKTTYWFLVILLINPAIAVLAYGLIRAGGQALPIPAPLTWAVFPLFAFFLVGALAEELGWTGYGTEPLLQRWGPIPASVLLGAVWATWHFGPLVQAQRTVAWILWWSLGTLSQRAIMVWLYVHGGKSVFGAALFHAMINLCWQLFPNNGSYYDPRVFGLVTLGVAVVLYASQRFVFPGKLPGA